MQISFNTIQAHPSNTPLNRIQPLRTQLSSDVVSFSGGEVDLFSLDDKSLLRRVKKSIKRENSIGRGGEAEVYKIPNTKYCVRVPHDSFDEFGKVVDKNILPSEKINHVVANLGNGITIMPVLEGYTFCSENITNEQVAKMVENMPQNAVDNLLKQVCEAYNNDMAFDTGWKNIIVNPINKTLTAIDFIQINDAFSSDRILGKVYLSLANNPETTKSQRKILASKILTSLAECISPAKLPIKDIYALGMPDLVKVLKSHNLFDNVMYSNLLRGIMGKLEDLKQQETIGKSVVNDLNGQLKILKSLIKQLF